MPARALLRHGVAREQLALRCGYFPFALHHAVVYTVRRRLACKRWRLRQTMQGDSHEEDRLRRIRVGCCSGSRRLRQLGNAD
ncbi:hypothetical protein NOVOSPHI9U_750012 [Novosphingobium sp. 9U]|nr:hypothetical protein NOVOSPHI9U_750012 [Novosphingobium sp. 9U]